MELPLLACNLILWQLPVLVCVWVSLLRLCTSLFTVSFASCRLLGDDIHDVSRAWPVLEYVDVQAIAARWFITTDLFAIVILLGGARVIINLQVRAPAFT